ncbi:MAG TPA: hypothetical protein VHS06_00160 [Chloroflexota bacterium]|nr:hypothetical protein [Chloroflexota bacterium]
MIDNRLLTPLRVAAAIAILLCMIGSEGLAQRERGRFPGQAPSVGATDSTSSRPAPRERRPHGNVAPPDVPEATPPARKGPLDVNTLRYALIDARTRAVTFIGYYDPAYATGPIPYADILKDTLDNPYPSFSIEPTQQQAQLERVDKMITADIARMSDPEYCNQWGQKLVNLLLNDASLPADSERFYAWAFVNSIERSLVDDRRPVEREDYQSLTC